MSGKNQHYIPRLVLRQFDANQAGKSEHVYSFHKDHGVRLKAIKRIASSFQFYSEDSPNSLDARITSYENKLARLRDKLLTANKSQGVNCEYAAEYVTHLMFRPDHFRSVIASSSERIIEGVLSLFNDEYFVRRLFFDENNLPTELLEKEFSAFSVSNNLHSFPAIQQILQKRLIDQFPSNYEFFKQQIDIELPKLQLKSKKAGEKAHKNILKESLSPPARKEELKAFKWHIVESSVEKFVLPDCIVIAFNEENQESFPLVYGDVEQIQFGLTPLSPYKLLIGCKTNKNFDFSHNFNEYAAKCSNRFFISSYTSDELLSLMNQVSSSASTFINKYVEQEIRDLVLKYSTNVKIEKS